MVYSVCFRYLFNVSKLTKTKVNYVIKICLFFTFRGNDGCCDEDRKRNVANVTVQQIGLPPLFSEGDHILVSNAIAKIYLNKDCACLSRAFVQYTISNREKRALDRRLSHSGSSCTTNKHIKGQCSLCNVNSA